MTAPIRPATPPLAGAAAPDAEEARLRKVARQMEGSFVLELFKAMRETVPQGQGALPSGSGEDTFTALMDQHLATETPTRWAHGLGDAIYRQLRAQLHPPQPPSAPTGMPTGTPAGIPFAGAPPGAPTGPVPAPR